MPGEADSSAAEAIFLAALPLPAAERPAYLRRACAGNEALRQRVEALLSAEAAPPGFLPQEHDPVPTKVPMPFGMPPELTADDDGERIGRYRLLETIGEGGCGIVYLAEQAEPVRRRVALKVIRLGMDTRQVVARFEAERQALALMDHPNIAKVFDAGATERGRPYFVMELVSGIKITEYCNQEELSTKQRLELFVQVCRAIQHAHQKGIIHRDIKPSNLLVATQDGVAVPKVIDFGIAKATQGRLTDQTLFTALEQFVGTPAYMSPEQAQLGSMDVDTRSDIYSLGVLLYELLTGTTPFDTKQLMAGGLDEIRRTILEKEPVTPSTRLKQELVAADLRRLKSPTPDRSAGEEIIRASSRRLLQELRGDLDWIVMKCLEKDRARRYETANGLALDIERYLNQEPVVARPPSQIYKLHKFVRRNRVVTAAATALVVGFALIAWQAVRASRAEHEQTRLRKEALAARQDATEKLWRSYLSEARALRVSGKAGRRFDSLEAIRKAVAIKPSLELRNEAIAAMLLPDIRLVGEKNFTQERSRVMPDAPLECYALCDRDGQVSIRRMADDHELSQLPPQSSAAIAPLSFSPDSHWLAIRYRDGTARVWDWSKRALALIAGGGRPGGFDFSPDSQRVAVSDGINVSVHDVSTGRRLKVFPLGQLGSDAAPGWFRFDPTGRRLALYNIEPGTNVLIMDIDSGTILKILPHPDGVFSLAWHPDARRLATAGADQRVYLWDTTSGERLQTLDANQAIRLVFNHRGNLLVTSGWDSKTRLWDIASGRELIRISESGNLLAFTPDDRRLGLTDFELTGLAAFEVAENVGVRTVYERPAKATWGMATFSHGGQLLGHPIGEGLGLWDTGARQCLGSLRGAGLSLIGFTAGDTNILFTSSQGLLRWPIQNAVSNSSESESSSVLATTECADRNGGRMGVVSADGQTCAIMGQTRCQVFRTDTFAKVAETGVQAAMRWLALSPDGSLVATGAWHAPGVRVWNARNGGLVKDLPADDGNPDTTAMVAFSPDGRFLVTSLLTECCFWEIPSWKIVRRLVQPVGNHFVAVMAFSPDSKVFAAMHAGNVVRLYDAASGTELTDLEAPDSGIITGLSFAADGAWLAASEGRDAVRVWDLRQIHAELAKLGLNWN